MSQINLISIMQKLINAAANDKRLEALAYNRASKRVTKYKDKLLKDFNNHEVTKEILAGPYASSEFLDYGNLNSFIGFNPGEGESQLDGVKTLLKEQIRVVRNPRSKTLARNSVTINFIVESPFLKDIWAVTEYPKGKGNVDRNGSWADNIETRGVGGFEYYLYLFGLGKPDSPASRSGPALQLNPHGYKAHTSGGMGKIDYIRQLLKSFREKVTE